jgi:hypothetical protein
VPMRFQPVMPTPSAQQNTPDSYVILQHQRSAAAGAADQGEGKDGRARRVSRN